MEHTTFFRWSTLISLGGVLFAGYLTISKLVSQVCPFNEPCPYFLGYPACWYGLGLFVLLFLASLLGLFGKSDGTRFAVFIRATAGVGILFSGSFVVREIINAFRFGLPDYRLLLPTCAYGLLVYIFLFILSHRTLSTSVPDITPPTV